MLRHSAITHLPLATETSFQTWLEGLATHERGTTQALPTDWYPVAYGVWLLAGNPPGKIRGGVKAVGFFENFKADPTQAIGIIAIVLSEEVHLQRDFADLLERHAISPGDVRMPSDVVRLLHGADFQELVALWRAGGRSRNLVSVAKQLARQRGVPYTPEPDRLLQPQPSSLREALEMCLPEATRPAAGHVAKTLALMKLRSHELWDMEAILQSVFPAGDPQRKTMFTPMSQALRWLSRNGVVENKNGYYVLRGPSPGRTLGQQILEIIR